MITFIHSINSPFPNASKSQWDRNLIHIDFFFVEDILNLTSFRLREVSCRNLHFLHVTNILSTLGSFSGIIVRRICKKRWTETARKKRKQKMFDIHIADFNFHSLPENISLSERLPRSCFRSNMK